MGIFDYVFYPFRIVVFILGYTLYFGVILFFSIAMLVLSLFISPEKALLLFHNGNHAALAFLVKRFLPAIKLLDIVSFENENELQLDGPFIVVGNHRSWIDAPVIFSRLHGLVPVMKEAYTRTIFYKIFVSKFDFIKVNDLNLESVKIAKEECEKLISSKGKILIYPEGSRSSSRELLPFKRMAFQLSREYNIPLVPVLQSSNYPCMVKGRISTYFPIRKLELRVKVLPAIYPNPAETSVQYMERVRNEIQREMMLLDEASISSIKK